MNEINLANRELMLSRTDLSLRARGGLAFEFRRSYRSYRRYAGPLGSGWDHNHNQRLVMDARDSANAEIRTSSGRSMPSTSSGSATRL